MKRTVVLCAAVLLLVATAVYSFGDIARPKDTPKASEGKTVLYTSMTVKPDPKASEARLQISQSTLQRIAHEAGNLSSNDSMTERLMHSSRRTMMAGLLLFFVVLFAGVWFARYRHRRLH